MFVLISFIITIILSIIDGVAGLSIVVHEWAPIAGAAAKGAAPIQIAPVEIGILYTIYTLAIFLPALGVAVRRLHDTGRSGWWWLINFVCCIGGITLIVFYCLPGTQGDNKYGPDPLNTN
jgi:uncharacterized membrane protein YhaH (DUF805 family)